MKRFPSYVYAIGGAVLAIAALVIWGRYKMKNTAPAPNSAAAAATTTAAEEKKTFAGQVFRQY